MVTFCYGTLAVLHDCHVFDVSRNRISDYTAFKLAGLAYIIFEKNTPQIGKQKTFSDAALDMFD